MTEKGLHYSPLDLSDLEDGDVRNKIEFRNIYNDLLRNWMHKDPQKIISKTFADLGII